METISLETNLTTPLTAPQLTLQTESFDCTTPPTAHAVDETSSQAEATSVLTETDSQDNSTTQESANLREKDENICESNDKTQKNSKKSDAYIAKLIEELIKERNKLVDLGIIKKEQAAIEQPQKKEVAPPQSSEDQENQDPKCEKELKVVPSQKNSKVRLSLHTPNPRVQNPQPKLSEKQEEYNVQMEEEATPNMVQAKKEKVQGPVISPRFEEILDINRSYVNFGLNMPGQISEESLEIVNKSNENIVVQIIIECHNAELQDTDEYVYSIRRTHLYDYNDKHLLLMSPFSSASFKLALKVPNMRIKDQIKGTAVFTIQGLTKSTKVPLDTTVVIPKLHCPKELYHVALKCNVIKLAMKSGKKQENKIPLKNNSPLPITLEFDFYKPKQGSNEPVNDLLECYCFPTVLSIPANGMGIVGILIKPKNPASLLNNNGESEKKYISVKKVLLGKCRESSLIYSFVLWIECHN